jgi:hypothetical protein
MTDSDRDAEYNIIYDTVAWDLAEAREELRKFAKGKDWRFLIYFALVLGWGLLSWFSNTTKDDYLLIVAVWLCIVAREEWKHAQLIDRYVQQVHSNAIMDRLIQLEKLLRAPGALGIKDPRTY